MANKKVPTASLRAAKRHATEELYTACRTGKVKDVPKLHKRYLSSHEALETRRKEEES